MVLDCPRPASPSPAVISELATIVIRGGFRARRRPTAPSCNLPLVSMVQRVDASRMGALIACEIGLLQSGLDVHMEPLLRSLGPSLTFC